MLWFWNEKLVVYTMSIEYRQTNKWKFVTYIIFYNFKERIFLKIKSILVKSIAVAAMSVTGLVVANNAGSNTAQAAIVQNDASVVTMQA